MQTKVKITGMHCVSCKKLIEDVAKEIHGVQSCTVDQTTGTGIIEHDGTFDYAKFLEEMTGLGSYKVEKL
ncbi:MAG: cation transporter [Candidatus Magasanikbacteria bacterium]|nr:cation transporter [Candidatus Magasanikbacteria bacterium]